MWLQLKKWYKKYGWLKRYHRASYLFTNFCIALIALNALLGFFLSVSESENSPLAVGPRVDLRAYEGVSKSRLREVLNDFHIYSGLGSVFRPYVQIGDPPFNSKTLNVKRDSYGFEYRQGKANPKEDAPVHAFVFGGSTSFGLNMADDWTLPAYLGEALGNDVLVRNYSSRSHSWFQQLVLFQRLLHAGHRPNVAVFIDGVTIQNNQWSKNYPAKSWQAARLWEEAQHGVRHTNLPEFIPLFRVLNILNHNRIEKKMSWIMEKRYAYLKPKLDLDNEAKLLRKSYLKTLRNRAAIAKAFGVTPYFIWQPNAAYECKENTELPHEYTTIVPKLYKSMRWVKEKNFINLSSLCKKTKIASPLFVDDVHYAPEFSKEIAAAIAKEILKKDRKIRELAQVPSS